MGWFKGKSTGNWLVFPTKSLFFSNHQISYGFPIDFPANPMRIPGKIARIHHAEGRSFKGLFPLTISPSDVVVTSFYFSYKIRITLRGRFCTVFCN
jgi:hypothetical protein